MFLEKLLVIAAIVVLVLPPAALLYFLMRWYQRKHPPPEGTQRRLTGAGTILMVAWLICLVAGIIWAAINPGTWLNELLGTAEGAQAFFIGSAAPFVATALLLKAMGIKLDNAEDDEG